MPRATITLAEYHRQMTNPQKGDITEDWNEAFIEGDFGRRELWDIAKAPRADGTLVCLCEPGKERPMPLDTKVFGRP